MRKLFLILMLGALAQLSADASSVQDHYSALIAAQEKGEWQRAIEEGQLILSQFPQTPFAEETLYVLGLGYFHQGDYDWANKQLSKYLKKASPKHFEEAIRYKFEIAEYFRKGGKKHLMGLKKLPSWQPAQDDALKIYEEVIAALPHHDLAAHSLFAKGELMVAGEDFRASVETFQTLIRRFPKHPLAAESYIGIGKVYLTQCQVEYPDPDFLDLAEINLRKFRTNFPRSERISVAEGIFVRMQERYAKDLFETARFFERTKKYSAAALYYSKVMSNYPQTRVAEKCKQRLPGVQKKIPAK